MIRAAGLCAALAAALFAEEPKKFDPSAAVAEHLKTMKVGPGDWPMWGGSPMRNNTPPGKNIPVKWDIKTGENIAWSVALGSQTYGNPVVANGKVFVGTNNGAGYVKRFPQNIDLGCLLCFDEKTGKFLWQHSNPKLPTGRVHDWPEQGVCAAVYADGERVWYVSNRGCVVCLDANGFLDGKNDGPFAKEPNQNKDEADVLWELDMMKDLSLSQHNMCSCSLTCVGDTLLVVTGNGVNEDHELIPQPNAPSFIGVDRNTGKVLWTDKSPATNILHGQWSSPAYAEVGGRKQALMGGGDGWLYSFDPAGEAGAGKKWWEFDANPKTSKYVLGAKATRNHLIGTPMVYDSKVFFAVGEDPEHGQGVGHLWCVDPTKSGDVSPHLVLQKDGSPAPRKRLQACLPENGETEKPNPNSAVVWHFGGPLTGELDPKNDHDDETMHRTIGSATIKDDLLFIVDFSGFVHCLDAKTGKRLWSDDLLCQSWSTPLIVEGKVYVADDDGDVAIYELSATKKKLGEINMSNAIESAPAVANDTLFIANRTHLFAIRAGAKSAGLNAAPAGK